MHPLRFLIAFGLPLLSAPTHAATLTLTATRDTTLFETTPDNNLGSSDLAIGVTQTGQSARALLQFDLGTLPVGSRIDGASLVVFATREAHKGGPATTLALHRSLVAWNEGAKTGKTGQPAASGDSTRNRRAHPSTSWSAPGGQPGSDYHAPPSATAILETLGRVEFASTAALVADIQLWLDQPAANHGLWLKALDETPDATARRFASTENTSLGLSPEPALAPQLHLTYTPPTAYDTWHLGFTPPLAADQRDRNADPDGDGLSNFLEYALGGDPRDPASAPDPVIGPVTQPTPALTLTYLRARGELTYAVETTDSLAPGSWTTIGVDQDNSTAAGSPATARFPHEATLEARRFLRLRITE